MTEEEMVEINNTRRKQLTTENLKYYEDMLVYLRLSRLPSKKTEELLLEILDHLLIAQREGRTAKDVFGEDPEAYCEDIVQSLGKTSLFNFRRYAFIFGIGLYIMLILDGVFRVVVNPALNYFFDIPEPEGFPVDWLLIPVFGILLIEFLMFILRKSTFKQWKWRMVLSLLPHVVIFGAFLLLYFLFKDMVPVIPLPAWLSLLLGITLWGIHNMVFKRIEVF